jgi:hypothetical protein
LVTVPFAWDTTVHVAVPPGLAFFKTEKSFSHGGVALQELIIPHLVSQARSAIKRIGVEVVLAAFALLSPMVKLTLRASSAAPQASQMTLFSEAGRTLSIDVLRVRAEGVVSVLPPGKKVEIRLDTKDSEKRATLFFGSAETFRKGELLELDIRDIETGEQFPPGGIKLTMGREI